MSQGLSNFARGLALTATVGLATPACLTQFPKAVEESADASIKPVDTGVINGRIADAMAPDAYVADAGSSDMAVDDANPDAQTGIDASVRDAAPDATIPDQGPAPVDAGAPDFHLDMSISPDAAAPRLDAMPAPMDQGPEDMGRDADAESQPDMMFIPVDQGADAVVDAQADAMPDAEVPFEVLCPAEQIALDCRFSALEVDTSLVYRNPESGELEVVASLPPGPGFHVDVVRSCLDVGGNPVAVGAFAPVRVVCRTINDAVRADIYEQQLQENELPIPNGVPSIADAPVADGVDTPVNRSAVIVFRPR